MQKSQIEMTIQLLGKNNLEILAPMANYCHRVLHLIRLAWSFQENSGVFN